jgi:uncharacterized protein YfiM (DUF2279 family)
MSAGKSKRQPDQLSVYKANSLRRQLGVTAGDADFLLGWPYKSWSKKEHASKITTDDIATLAQRVAEVDLSEAKPEEFLAARESVGLFAEECDRLLGKTPSWWLNREIGLAKAPRFYIEAMLCLPLPCKRVYFDDESGQRLLRYFIKQRIRVGNTCRDVDRALGKRKGWWFSVEAGGQKYVFESDIEALDHHFMLLSDAEKMASPEGIRAAREGFRMSQKQAAQLLKWSCSDWGNRERGQCNMSLRDLNRFIKLASRMPPIAAKEYASKQEIREARTATGLNMTQASQILGKRHDWWMSREKLNCRMNRDDLNRFTAITQGHREYANKQEIRDARTATGLNMTKASQVIGNDKAWWWRRERSDTRMSRADLDRFIALTQGQLSSKVSEADYKSTSGQELRVQKTA